MFAPRSVLLAFFALTAVPVSAELVPAPVTPADDFVETYHQVETVEGDLQYTARAGLLPLYDNDTGALMARIFIIAYVDDRGPGEPPRPLTFLWNGGPGSSSSQVHLLAFGPKGFETPATYPEWLQDPPSQIGDRATTWLTESDLVFVDPVGTGYSRATSTEYRDLLYSTHGDAEAVAEAIRLYRTRYDAWDQPLILAGESYGTTRAMGVAEALERRRADIAGVILISGFYDAGQQVAPELMRALNIPMYTAAGHYHGRLPPDLQAMSQAEAAAEAEAWARAEYAPALANPGALSDDERTAIVAGVVRYTGVAVEFVDTDSLTLEGTTFEDRLLDTQELELGHYDYRMTFPRRDLSRGWAPIRDPSLMPMLDLMQGTSVPMIRYIRNTLGYHSDLLYRGPFGGAFHPQPLVDVTRGAFGSMDGIYDDWMAVMWDWGESDPTVVEEEESGDESAEAGASQQEAQAPPPVPQAPPLQKAMLRNPDFIVWNIRGLYDMSCPAMDEMVTQTPEALRSRVRNGCYVGGHMLYTEPEVRRQLHTDFAEFVSDAVATQQD
jgi:carboxypeptidase C (cathepsin A)